MPTNNATFNLNVKTTVDMAAVNKLKQSLIEVSNIKPSTLASQLGIEMNEARSRIASCKIEALKLQNALSNAFDPKLNILNINKFRDSLNSLNLTDTYNKFAALGPAGVKSFQDVATTCMTTNLKLKESQTLVDKIGITFANTIRWQAATAAINKVTGSIQEAWGFSKRLDSSLNDIRIVTGKSADEMERFAEVANKAAQSLGTATVDYTKASLIYYQQGLSDEDVQARTDVTLKAANVTGQSTDEVSEQLTAIWNGYKVSAEEAEEYIDKVSAVAATTAADLEELATGMSKVASAANAMGVDVDQLNAQLATIVSVTRQAPESVGTALKTVYARMSTIQAGGEDEDGATLTSYTEKMNQFGISVLDADNSLRDMGEVIEEIGGKWKTFNREQQVSLAQAMAGTRQYNNLLALFENFDMYTNALKTSQSALGTLQKQQDIYMESTEAHLQKLSTATEHIFDSLVDNKAINVLLDGVTLLTKGVGGIVDSIGGGAGILTGLLAFVNNKFAKSLGTAFAPFITNIQNAKDNLKILNNDLETTSFWARQAGLNDEVIDTVTQLKMEVQQYYDVMSANEIKEADNKIKEIANLMQEVESWENNQEAMQNYFSALAQNQSAVGGQGNFKKLKSDDLTNPDFYKDPKNANVVSTAIENDITAMNNGKKALEELEKAYNTYANTEKSENKYEKLKKTVENTLDTIKKLPSGYDFDTTKAVESLEKTEIALEKIVKLYKEEAKYNDKLKDKTLSDTEKAEIEKKRTNVIQERNEATKHPTSSLRTKDLLGGQELTKSIEASAKSVKNYGNQIDKTNNKIEAGKEQISILTNSLIDNEYAVRQTIQEFSHLASGITGVGFGITSLTSAVKNLGDTSKGIGTRIGSFITGIAFGLPSLLNGLNRIKTSFQEIQSIRALANGTAVFENLTLKGKETFLRNNLTLERLENKLNADQLKLLGEAYGIDVKDLQTKTAIVEKLKEEKILTKAINENRDTNGENNDQINEFMDLFKGEGNGENLFTKLGSKLKDNFAGLAKSLGISTKLLGSLSIGIAAVAAAYGIWNAVVKKNNENLKKQQEEIIKTTKAQQESIETQKELVKSYDDLYKRYQAGEDVKDDLFNTSNELAKAYDNEGLRVLALSNHYDELNEKLKELQETNGGKNFEQLSKGANASSLAFSYGNLAEEGVLGGVFSPFNSKLGTNNRKFNAYNSLTVLGSENILAKNGLDQFTGDLSTAKGFNEYYNKVEEAYNLLAESGRGASRLALRINEELESLKETKEEIDSFTKSGTEQYVKSLTSDLSEISEKNIDGYFEKYNEITDNLINSFGGEEEDYREAILNTLSDYENLQEYITNHALAINISSNLIDQKATMEEIAEKIGALSDGEKYILTLYPEIVINENNIDNLDKILDQSTIDQLLRKNIISNVSGMLASDENINSDDIEKLGDKFNQFLTKQQLTIGQFINSSSEQQHNLLVEYYNNLIKDFNDYADEVKDAKLIAITEAEKQKYERDKKWLADESKWKKNGVSKFKDTEGNRYTKKDLEDEIARYEAEMAANEARQKATDSAALEISETEKLTPLIESETKRYEKLTKALDNAQSTYKLLSDIEEDYNESGVLTLDNLQSLMELSPQYIRFLEFENGKIKLNTEGLLEEAKAQVAVNTATWARLKADEAIELIEDKKVNELVELVNLNKEYAASEFAVARSAIASIITTAQQNGVIGEQLALIKELVSGYNAIIDASENTYKNFSLDAFSGGGSSAKRTLKDLDDEFDRYWDINKAIQACTDALEELNDLQEHLHGKQLIQSLEQENSLLERQAENYRNLAAAQKEEASELQGKLNAYGINFNESGAITNYAAVTASAVAKYNAGGDEEDYEKFKTLLDRYDELFYNEMVDTTEQLREIMYEELANNLEAWETKISIGLDLREAEREWNDFFAKINENFKLTYKNIGEEFANIFKNIETYLGNTGTIAIDLSAISDIEKEIDNIMAGAGSDKYASLSEAQEELKEYMNQIKGDTEDVYDLYNDMWDAFLDGIDQSADKFDDLMDKFDLINDELEFQGELISLLYGDEAYDMLNKLNQAQQVNDLVQISSLKQQKDMWEELYKTAEDGTEEQTAYYEQWTAAQTNLNKLVTEYIKLLKEDYVNTVKSVLKDLEKFISGSALSLVGEQWERISDYSDKYFDSIESAYEIQNLANKIQNSISEVDDLNAQKKLQQLYDEEITYLREKDTLTQYDMDRAEAKYNLTLKQIALENAQNNKTSMRLTRNSQGNWTYQYVADEGDVLAKQQELAEAYQNLYELAKNAYQENLESMQDLTEKYLENAEKIATDDILTEEEKQIRLKELRDNYLKDYARLAEENQLYRNHLQEEGSNLTAYLCELDAENIKNLGEAANLMMSDVLDEWTSKAQNLADVWNADDGKSVKAQVNSALNEIISKNEEFGIKADEVAEIVERDFSEDGITGALNKAINATNSLSEVTQDLADKTRNAIANYRDNINTIGDAFSNVSSQTQNAINLAEEYLKKMANIADIKMPEVNLTTGTYNGNANTNNGPSNISKTPQEDNIKTYRIFVNDVQKFGTGTESTAIAQADYYTKQGYILEKHIGGDWYFISKKPDEIIKNNISTTSGISGGSRTFKIPMKFASGGYTGEWGANGKIAVLHEKELVLNKEDTANILNAVSIMRALETGVASSIAGMSYSANSKFGIVNNSTNDNLNNTFNIEMNIDGGDTEEIKKAILSLPNIASQYMARR